MQKIKFGSWSVGYDDVNNAVLLLVTPSSESNFTPNLDIIFTLNAQNVTEVLEAWVKGDVTPVAMKGQPIEQSKMVYTFYGDENEDSDEGYEDYSPNYTIDDPYLAPYFAGEPKDYEVSFLSPAEQKEMFEMIFNYPMTDWVLMESMVKV